ncbi:MAG: SIS domain-containing protein [Chloroflexota bacterium]
MSDEQATGATLVTDLERKPEALGRLADALADPAFLEGVPERPRRIVLTGMGSSRYAAEVAAQRLRAAGLDAVAELASAATSWPPGPDVLVLAISATGRSEETLTVLERHRGSRIVALTEVPDSPIAAAADGVVPLHAGPETSGVACRTFQHTLLVLRAIEARLTGVPHDTPGLVRRVADASADLLDRRGAWLPEVADALDAPSGVYVLAPAERWSSAAQSALMVREGPRRPATGCETGDWSHVDVYLTKTLDYRALLLTGSRWDAQAVDWMRLRGSTFVAVGGPVDGAAVTVRYRGDDDPAVALATETLIAELVAARWWV